MSLINFTQAQLRSWRSRAEKRALLAEGPPPEITRDQWAESLRDPRAFYDCCFRYFHLCVPGALRSHRAYFTRERRGFGEDAFHTLWFLLFREFKLREFLEIGVYRGQTLSLAALLQRHFACVGEVVGVSPFSPAGDSVSKYLDLDYYEDTFRNFAEFSLPRPRLLKAFSTDDAAVQLIGSRPWDCIYIDGNHDYEIVRRDWNTCSAAVKPGGLVVLDDSGLTTVYRPRGFATAGHPGPSRLASEIDGQKFRELLQVGHNRVWQKIA